jgi:hypothetical protein
MMVPTWPVDRSLKTSLILKCCAVIGVAGILAGFIIGFFHGVLVEYLAVRVFLRVSIVCGLIGVFGTWLYATSAGNSRNRER